ncbi:MAG: ester cyclase [Halieaceae bacterium]|nr:ester cyclase [Halieaceae bacterium]
MDPQHYDSAPADGEPNGLPGFDPEFKDIVDYILRITYRIWEGKQVGLCHDYYSEDCPVYTLAGYSEGAEVVMQNTIRTLGGFPDRTLHADNIVWGGDAEAGYHSSHLISTHMTNLGPSEFGPATGKQATIQVIAHCVCKDNRIVEEWLVRDNLSLARQLGVDHDEWAAQKAAEPLDPNSPFAQWLASEAARVGNVTRERSPYPGDPRDHRELQVARALHNIWNARMVGDTNVLYAEDAVLHASAREDAVGTTAIARFYMDMMSCLPDARLAVDYTCSQSMRDDGDFVAARWTLAGTHTGGTLWGAPTGAPILILGESQYRMINGKVVEEWLVFDELAVLTQVHRARQK